MADKTEERAQELFNRAKFNYSKQEMIDEVTRLAVAEPAVFARLEQLARANGKDNVMRLTNKAKAEAAKAEAMFKEIQKNKDVKARNAAYTKLKRENPSMFAVLEHVANKNGVHFKRIPQQQKGQQQQPAQQQKPAQQKPAQQQKSAQQQQQGSMNPSNFAWNRNPNGNQGKTPLWMQTPTEEAAYNTWKLKHDAEIDAANLKKFRETGQTTLPETEEQKRAQFEKETGMKAPKAAAKQQQTASAPAPQAETRASAGTTARAAAPARESAANTGNAAIDAMIRRIENMNSRNGASRSIDAVETATKLYELYGENAGALLNKAINEPSNYAAEAGADVKTSRAAVQHLTNLDKEQANQLAANMLGIEQPQADDRPKEERLKEQLTQLAEGDSKTYGELKDALVNFGLGRDVGENLGQLIMAMMQQCGYSQDAVTQFVADAGQTMSDIEQGGATQQNDVSGHAMGATMAGNERTDGSVAPAQEMDLEALRKAGINISQESLDAMRALGVKIESGTVQVDGSGRIVGFTPHEKPAQQQTVDLNNSRADMAMEGAAADAQAQMAAEGNTVSMAATATGNARTDGNVASAPEAAKGDITHEMEIPEIVITGSRKKFEDRLRADIGKISNPDFTNTGATLDMASTATGNARADGKVAANPEIESDRERARELLKTPRKFKSAKKAYEKAAAGGDARAAELLAIMNEVDSTTKKETTQTAQNDQKKAQKVIAATEEKAAQQQAFSALGKGGNVGAEVQLASADNKLTQEQEQGALMLQKMLDRQSGRGS